MFFLYLCAQIKHVATCYEGKNNYDLMKKQISIILLLVGCLMARAENVVWYDGSNPVTYRVVGKTDPVVMMALQMFCEDMELVTGKKPVSSPHAAIRIVQGKGSDDGFCISVEQGQTRQTSWPTA